MTKDEVLKLALEALYPISHNSTDDYRGQADKAITAIREALAQPDYRAMYRAMYLKVRDELAALQQSKTPLTQQDLARLWMQTNDYYKFAKAIEAAHGIKENT